MSYLKQICLIVAFLTLTAVTSYAQKDTVSTKKAKKEKVAKIKGTSQAAEGSDGRIVNEDTSSDYAKALATINANREIVDTVDLYIGAERLSDNASPKKYRIKKVNVRGVESFNTKVIASSIGLTEGDSILLPGSATSAIINKLWNQRRYSDVKMGATIEGGDVEIDIYLKERPRVYNWEITGTSKGKRSDLFDKLKLRRNSELSDYIIEKNKVLIKNTLAEDGFRNAEVDVLIENDTIRPQMVNVTFKVDPKEKVRIGEIVFDGNEAFADKRLAKTFKKTHRKTINFFKSSKLNEDEYKDDKELLIDFYNSKGYRNATIISDTIYQINDKRIGIKLKVSEGNKYYIRNISWVGNSIYETEQLEAMFGVKSGDTYDKKSMNKRLGVGKDANPEEMSILSLYQNEGYLMSQIDPAEIIIGRDSIDLELKIFEGKPFVINNVKISGNERVDDEVIRREVYTRPGELYNRSLLMQTIRTLGTMGHFNPEAIAPNIQPVSNDKVDIGWALEEQASDQFNISGGWGSGSIVASVGITLNNISTKSLFNGGSWSPYPMGQNQKLSISAQTNGSYYKSASLSFTDPWVGGKKPNSLTLSAYYSDQNDAYYAWQSSSMYFRSLGLAAGLGKRLTWPDPYFTLYSELAYQRYMLSNWSSFVMNDGNANMLSFKFVFSRNSVDQQIYPRRGSEFSASVQFTPPYSLFNGIDYSDDNDDLSDSERYKWIEFHKWQFKAQVFQGFMKNSNLVLMMRAEMGYLGNYNTDFESPFERFEVGGDGMSGYSVYGIDVVSLRGYDDGALDPTDGSYSMAYNKYTMELRYPIILQPSSQIYALAFLEAGNGFNRWEDFSPFKVKRSAGVGVRVYLPIVGLLGLDWAYGFDAASGASDRSGSQFHFVIGQQF
ncbi:MAG: POTRA domain-containing protein [Rikenellaceae bacterium]